MRLARLLALALFAVIGVGAPASAERARITPYIEVQQVFDADLNNGGDVLTYTTLAAGVDGSVRSRRVEATVSYRYERRLAYDRNLADESVHYGLARARAELTPALSVEGGAIATRAHTSGGGADFLSDGRNVSQVYGIYAGPTLATTVGPLAVGASYRLGYVKVDDSSNVTLTPGQPRLDSFDHAVSQMVDLSVGMPSGQLPFGWTVTAGYMREDASQLDQRYQGKYVRGDVTVPVGPTVALTAGAGYEDIAARQRDPLRNPDGSPVLDRNGRFVTDPAAPRRLAYATDGLIYDVGVIWRPNRRTTLQARVGRRYGATAVTGSFDLRLGPSSGLQVGVYNYVDSFGRSLTRSLASLPTSFDAPRNPISRDFATCVFGTNPGTGGCLDDTLQSISTSNFRARGIGALYSRTRGPWSMGIGAGYAQRKYLAPTGVFFTVNGVKDESFYIQGDVARRLTASSGVNATIYADWYKSGVTVAGVSDVTSGGATASYHRSFTDRLVGQASVGLFAYEQEPLGTQLSGQLLLGLRYQF